MSDPQQPQPAPSKPAPPGVGAALKAARTRKALTLEAAAQQTRIPRKHLEALENDRFEELPAPVYLRGFLKSYCDFLDLSFDPLWRQLEAEMSGEPAEPAAAAVPAAATGTSKAPSHAPAAKAAPKPPRSPSHHREPEKEEGGDAPLAAALALGTAVLVLGGAWALQGALRRHSAAPEHPALPSALQPVAAPEKPTLALTLAEDAWLSVQADGRELFSGRAPRGASQEWTAEKSLSLRTNRPEALTLTIKGQAAVLPAPDASGAYRIE